MPTAALETLAAAQSLGGEVVIGVFGEGAASSIGTLAVEGEAFVQPRYSTDAVACER